MSVEVIRHRAGGGLDNFMNDRCRAGESDRTFRAVELLAKAVNSRKASAPFAPIASVLNQPPPAYEGVFVQSTRDIGPHRLGDAQGSSLWTV